MTLRQQFHTIAATLRDTKGRRPAIHFHEFEAWREVTVQTPASQLFYATVDASLLDAQRSLEDFMVDVMLSDPQFGPLAFGFLFCLIHDREDIRQAAGRNSAASRLLNSAPLPVTARGSQPGYARASGQVSTGGGSQGAGARASQGVNTAGSTVSVRTTASEAKELRMTAPQAADPTAAVNAKRGSQSVVVATNGSQCPGVKVLARGGDPDISADVFNPTFSMTARMSEHITDSGNVKPEYTGPLGPLRVTVSLVCTRCGHQPSSVSVAMSSTSQLEVSLACAVCGYIPASLPLHPS